MDERFRPSVSVGIKLASIAVHVEELLSPGGHAFDRVALEGLLEDPQVVAYIDTLRPHALLPEKRNG